MENAAAEKWLPVLSNLQRCRIALHTRSSDRFSLVEWRSIGANIYYNVNGITLLLCFKYIVYSNNDINYNNILIHCGCALLSVPTTCDRTKEYDQWHASADAVFSVWFNCLIGKMQQNINIIIILLYFIILQ